MTHTVTSNSDGLLSAKPPKPTLSIGKEKVLLAIGVIGLLIVVGVVSSNRSKGTKPTIEASRKPGIPAYNITSLPSTYAELPPPTPPPTPAAKIKLESKPLSNLEALEKKALEERLQRANSAKLASVSFQNFHVPQDSRQEGSPPPLSQGDTNTTSTTNGSNSRDGDNRQDDKNSYLSERRVSPVALNQKLISPHSPYQLMAGTLIPGLLLTALNSDLPGQILGQVSQNVFDTVTGNHLLLPQGTKVIGEYDSRIVYGQERVLIVWTRLILPNGKSISLEGMPGVDLSGSAGLSDQVNHHWGRLITSVVFSSLLGASAQIAQGRTYNSFDPDYGELATQGFAQNMTQVGQQITRKNLNIQPTIEIRPGFRFNVFVNKDLTLEVYHNS
jgi:type IV secretory pathway VirB10-like protein